MCTAHSVGRTLRLLLLLGCFSVAVQAVQRPRFEALKRNSSAVMVAAANGTMQYLGDGVALSLGETVTLVCSHPHASLAIVKWRESGDLKESFTVVRNRSFTPQFTELRMMYPQLGRYETLLSSVKKGAGGDNFTALIIRNFQLDDAGEYGCVGFTDSQQSEATNVSLILNNTVYALRLPDWPTRRFVLSPRRVNTAVTLLLELDRHPNVASDLRVQVCSEVSGEAPRNCRDRYRWLVAPHRVRQEEQSQASRWSSFWGVRKVRELWNMTVNATMDLAHRSLVARTTDGATGRTAMEYVTFVHPEDVSEPSELRCVPLADRAYQGDIVTFFCRVRPASNALQLFWLAVDQDGKEHALQCEDAEVCQLVQGIRVYGTLDLLHLNEAQMKLDVIVDANTTARWSYRAAMRVHTALFYSDSFTISLRSDPPVSSTLSTSTTVTSTVTTSLSTSTPIATTGESVVTQSADSDAKAYDTLAYNDEQSDDALTQPRTETNSARLNNQSQNNGRQTPDPDREPAAEPERDLLDEQAPAIAVAAVQANTLGGTNAARSVHDSATIALVFCAAATSVLFSAILNQPAAAV